MDAAALVASFSTGTYTVTRRAKATYTAGRAVAGSTSQFSITASVQPASGRDLARLPEGRSTNETRAIFTATQLTVGDDGANEADLVTIDGETWEVQHVEVWAATPTSTVFYQALAQRPG